MKFKATGCLYGEPAVIMSGKNFEHLLYEILKPRYKKPQSLVKREVVIGVFAGKGHRADVLILTNSNRIVISGKHQNSRGTAEEKILYELEKLQHAHDHLEISHSYLVYGGTGWTKMGFFHESVKKFPNVDLICYEDDKELSFLPGDI